MKTHPPTIYIEPQIQDVLVLEFHKAEQVYLQCESASKQLRDELKKLL